jgi:hypothetical protein
MMPGSPAAAGIAPFRRRRHAELEFGRAATAHRGRDGGPQEPPGTTEMRDDLGGAGGGTARR